MQEPASSNTRNVIPTTGGRWLETTEGVWLSTLIVAQGHKGTVKVELSVVHVNALNAPRLQPPAEMLEEWELPEGVAINLQWLLKWTFTFPCIPFLLCCLIVVFVDDYAFLILIVQHFVWFCVKSAL